MTDVRVVACLRAKPEHRDVVEQALLRCAGPSRAEEGNLSYVVHHDLDDPLLFVVVEHWESLDIRNRHVGTAHFKRLGVEVDDAHVLSEHYFNVLRPIGFG